jgi:hypothetical protein
VSKINPQNKNKNKTQCVLGILGKDFEQEGELNYGMVEVSRFEEFG